ncbi:MAG: hypothetical protein EHM42_13295, partial [Planctomycetaceae bacterium]
MTFPAPFPNPSPRRGFRGNPVVFLLSLALAGGTLAAARNAVLADRFDEQIAAGEFGPAIDAAARLDDSADKAVLLHKIARAQLAAGDFDGARATAQRQPQREERARGGADAIRGKSAAGGGSLADFTELIDLITSTVQPDSWDETGGPGSVRQYTTGVFVDPQGQLRQASR